jgi:hypothetical protein
MHLSKKEREDRGSKGIKALMKALKTGGPGSQATGHSRRRGAWLKGRKADEGDVKTSGPSPKGGSCLLRKTGSKEKGADEGDVRLVVPGPKGWLVPFN